MQYILRQLPELDHWCVELGAWDGVYLSNTYYLISHAGYNAVLVEGDKNRFEALTRNMLRWPGVICINKFVGIGGPDSLDCILAETPIKENFDLLSIDIDGEDYHVWNCLNNYRPKVIIIEIGLYYKPGIHKINEIGSNYVYGVSGSSISSMTELAEHKGYKLICCIGCNASKGTRALATWLKSRYCLSRGITERSVAPVVQAALAGLASQSERAA